MTTSWAYVTRAQLGDALRAHVGGTLLAVATAMAAVASLVAAARGRWIARMPSEVLTVTLVAVGVAGLFGEWIARLWTG